MRECRSGKIVVFCSVAIGTPKSVIVTGMKNRVRFIRYGIEAVRAKLRGEHLPLPRQRHRTPANRSKPSAGPGIPAHPPRPACPTFHRRPDTATVIVRPEHVLLAESGPILYAEHGASGRRRVRGKDCVHLEVLRQTCCFDELFSARASGHRAHRLTRHAQPGKELMVNDNPTHSRTSASIPISINSSVRRRNCSRRFAAGEADAVAEVNAHYRDADAAAFALHDAQLVLARSYGFDSWPKLKAYVDGVTVKRLAEAVRAGDLAQVRAHARRPVRSWSNMEHGGERRASRAALRRARSRAGDGASADGARRRRPPRDLSASRRHQSADDRHERGYDEIVAIIEEEEQRRRETKSGANAPVTAVQDELSEAICRGDETRAHGDPRTRAGADSCL